MIKYFLLQRICSILFILNWLIYKNIFFIIIILFIKIGLPPFHYWVIDLLKFSSWKIFFYLITIQKLGLYFILSYFIINKIIIILIILMSIVLRLFIIFIINNIINIIIFSSFIHNRWLLRRLFIRKKLFLIYFILYVFFINILYKILINYNLLIISQSIDSIKWWVVWILMGLPPFSLFLIKWSISLFLIKWSISLFLIFIITTFFILYIYFKFIYLIFLQKTNFYKKQIFTKNKFLFIIIIEILIFGIVLF